jgi:group I intron endonuclease
MKYYLYYTFKKDEPIKGYIGMTHYEINSGYKGSGKYLKSAFKKYGTNQFRRIDLCEFNNIDECYYWEGFYIKYYKTLVSQGGYNISPKGGIKGAGSMSEETRKKISDGNRGKFVSDETRNKFKGNKNPFYGKHHTEESKINISKNSGSHKKEVRIKISKGVKGKNLGRKHSEETKEKNRNSHLGKIPWNKGNKNNFRGKCPK